ncbi:hypothetical protein FLB_19150 [Flavobacterium succinicans]|uniref:DUF4468 domain-containing protein n=2 Tax=Flavobacterium succinicans TaxID=29536 RepID=A0A199XPH1_9FLAO|nr:hypothetical protein FLB_19150 [Flavobacterium succinicans]
MDSVKGYIYINLNFYFMKYTLLGLMIFASFLGFAQDFTKDNKTLTGVFEAQGKSKAELFSVINKWISVNYNSSKNVIQMNDLDSGTIIIKGINEVKTKNALKSLYPMSMPEYNYYEFNHMIEINIKDNKYRVIFKLTDLKSEVSPNDKFNFDCVNFNGVEQNVVDEYNSRMDKLLKMGFVGSKKRDAFKASSKGYLHGVNDDIVNYEKDFMLSIQKTVSTISKDNW